MYRVVVTGISSFIGSHIASCLSKKGFEVIGTGTKPKAEYSGIRLSRINFTYQTGVKYKVLNILDEVGIRRFIDNTAPNYWFHLPAWTKDWGSLDYDLGKAFQIQVLSLNTIYKSLVKNNAAGIIITGSDSEYGNLEMACSEDHNCQPVMPYGFGKLMSTLHSRILANKYNLSTRVGRVFIPFGNYENPKKIIPTVLASLESKQSIKLSPCNQKRDFLYIDDLTDGFLKLMLNLGSGELFDIFNICSGKATSLKDILIKITNLFGYDRDLLRFGEINLRKGEPKVLFGNNIKAKTLLNWEITSLNKSLMIFRNTLN